MAPNLLHAFAKKQPATFKLHVKQFFRHYGRSYRENRGYVPTLSPPQVTAQLSANESSTSSKIQGKYPVSGFVSNQIASNSPIEDRRATGKLLLSNASLFAVFDGHAGPACAQTLKERLFDYIAVSLLSYEQLVEYNHCLRTDTPMDLLERSHFPNDYRVEERVSQNRASVQKYVVETLSLSGLEDPDFGIYDAFTAAFNRLDTDISFEAMPTSGVVDENMLEVAMSGSCANVVHISGRDIHVANTGDCRAVLGSFDAESSEWVATALSKDHNSDNKEELKRLRASHPVSEASFLVKSNRLLGLLVPLRAFGDIRYKWSLKDLKSLVSIMDSAYAQSIIPMNYYTPPYLIPTPEIKHHRLTTKDKFLVLASDGLWDMLTNDQVVSLVGQHIIGAETQDKFLLDNLGSRRLGTINNSLQGRKTGLAHKSSCLDPNAATHLIRHALGYKHGLVSEMLTFPPYIARHYRDDMTIIVIYFDTDYISTH